MRASAIVRVTKWRRISRVAKLGAQMNRMERWNRTFWHRGAHNAPRHVQIRVQALSDLIGDCQEVTYAVCSQMFQ